MKQRNFGRFDSHHPCIWRCVVVCCAFVLMSFFGGPSSAEIVTDGTVGPVQNMAGPHFQIGSELGTIRGANLFHSFQTFNIYTGESATYTGPASIENVISRITGGEISTINGLLRSEVGRADFYFINPSGVIFGPNAQVNVPGAFHVSTATELRFEDDTVYNATDTGASTLSLAQPESFGFLSPQPASITVTGSRLEFTPDGYESLSAGDVTIQDGASLVSAGGDIRITAIGDSGGVLPLAAEPGDSAASGTVTVTGASTIDVSGTEGSESVALRGGQVEVADSMVAADHSGNEAAGGQILLEADSVRVINSDIRAQVFGAGRGNDILVVADDLEVDAATATDGRSCLKTRVMSGASGAAGDVRVEATEVTLTNGGQLSSIIEDGGMGQGGTVKVEATDSIIIESSNEVGFFSGIYSTSLSEVGADGGDILIDAPDAHVTIADGGVLQGGTAGPGDSGSISIEADELHILDEVAVWTCTQGSGAGGNVTIAANRSVLLDNAEIDTSSYDTGAAGHILLTSGELSLLNNSEILADTYSSRDAGSITISADLIELREGRLSATTGNTGKAGEIRLEARDSVFLSDNSEIQAYSGTLFTDSQLGDAGKVIIKTGSLSMLDSCIDVFSFSLANAGTIQVIADEIHVDNTTDGIITALNASNFGERFLTPGSEFDAAEEGRSGIIDLTASGIIFDHGVNISIITNAGDGGSIVIRADELSLLNGSSVFSPNSGLGHGGDVQIDVTGSLLIKGGSPQNGFTLSGGITTSPTFLYFSETGPAGTISISAETLVVGQDSEILSASFSNASAGPITLNVGTLEIKAGGEISSSAGADGPGADIIITAQKAVSVHGVDPTFLLDSSEITADAAVSSNASGKGGSILIEAPVLLLEQGGALSSVTGGSGAGGTIKLEVEKVVINSGGKIDTSTSGSAPAGVIDINADSVSINKEGGETLLLQETGLFSRTYLDATGDAGTINVSAESTMELLSGARITAESTGNVPAGAVEIQAGELLLEGESRITTESNEADGGPISIGGQNIVLRDSLITTSVLGFSGDGGNININADAFVLQGGFIQGNTAAPSARGGDIFIDTDALVASYDLLGVGGTERLTFQPGSGRNVIQAAAPGGVHGTISITSPELDIGGALVPLSTRFADTSRLISDPCVAAAGKINSSLIQRGKGGLPQGPEQPAAVFFGGDRLDRLLDSDGGQSVNDSQASEGTNSPTGSQRGQ